MRPSDFVAIRPYLERSIDDIDYFLNCEKKRENAEQELSEVYDSMLLVAESERSVERSVERWENEGGLIGGDGRGKPTNERAEAVAALPGEPMSDEEWDALQYNLRGGWRESSRQAAFWLGEAKETVLADAIDVELSRLPDEQRLDKDVPSYRDAERKGAEQVRKILTTCIKEADTKTDTGKIAGRNVPPPEVNETIRYVRSQRKEITKGKRPKATLKALIAEHLSKDVNSNDVKSMARQLQPSRYGGMLEIGQTPDK